MKTGQEPRQEQTLTNKLRQGLERHLLAFWGVFGAVALVVGFVATVFFFLPKVSVTPGVILRTSDPFATMFTIHNEGSFSVYSLKFSCLAYRVTHGQGGVEIIHSLGDTPAFDVLELKANEKTSTPCYIGISDNRPLESADIAVIVSYRPLLIPWTFKRRSRFVAKRDSQDQYHWIEMADYAAGHEPTP